MLVYIMTHQISVGLLLVFIVSAQGDCPNGYVRHDESCYKFFSSVFATWAEAVTYCELFDSRLAVIKSEREQNFIAGFLSREYHYQRGLPAGVWVGGTDLLVEGEWVWADTGESIPSQTFQKWYPGEPNSNRTQGEDCMDLQYMEGFSWNDEACERKQTFLCKKERDSIIDSSSIIGK